MHTLTPKEPTTEEYAKLRRLRIDSKVGKVYLRDVEVGSLDPTTKYYRISCGHGVTFKRSHVIWWAAKGAWPKQLLDHKNRDKTDDSIGNLIESTQRANTHNSERMLARDLPPNVAYNRGSKKNPYKVGIYVKSVYHYLGSYPTIEVANNLATKARKDLELLTYDEWIHRYGI